MKTIITLTFVATTGVAMAEQVTLPIPQALAKLAPLCAFESWKPLLLAPITETDPAKAKMKGWYNADCEDVPGAAMRVIYTHTIEAYGKI